MKELLGSFLHRIPQEFKSGPWHPFSIVYLIVFATSLFTCYFDVQDHYSHVYFGDKYEFIPYFRLMGGYYCLAMLIVLIYNAGWLPIASYTVTSWNLLTARLILSYLGHVGFEWCHHLANYLLFPALVGCTITVVVWWSVLVPLIHTFLDPHKKVGFWKFNTSFMLLNLHGMNLVFAALDFLGGGRTLNYYDLWSALLVAFIYVVFYLHVLDPAGYHFYIILTPRTPWCVVVYSSIIGLYYATFVGWNLLYEAIE
mmetsp:Transcript_12546/g.18950  ORF Transcript_12546/g.18950 Transcript_12546/m.18950 type:complete len:255 (-) Transcript_12546:218-982(-)